MKGVLKIMPCKSASYKTEEVLYASTIIEVDCAQ